MSEQEQQTIDWSEALTNNGEFMKFEEGKRVKIAIQNWRLVMVEKEDINDKTKIVTIPQFEADVVMQEGEPVTKKLSILSKRFMAGVRPFLEGKPADKIYYLSIKKIGKDQSTNYDVEEYTPTI